MSIRTQEAKDKTMKNKSDPKLATVILDVVNNQLAENEPPETRETYLHLIKSGHSDKEAKKLIGAVLSVEIYEMLKEKKEYDKARYKKNLENLPAMPWAENDQEKYGS